MEHSGQPRIAAGRCPRWAPVVMATVLLLQVLPTTSLTADNAGREFIFAFPPNYIQDNKAAILGIIFESSSPNVTDVDVMVPLRGYSLNITLDPGSPPYHLDMPSNLVRAMISGLTQATVMVRSSEDIRLVAYNIKDFTMDLFTVLPTAHMGTEYFVATRTKPSGGIIQISAFGKTTEVNVQLTAPVEFFGANYHQGDIIRHELKPYETMQLEPMSEAIVGTRIIANRSIAVVVGCLCAYIPKGVQRCDHLAEQMVPFDRWGRSFLINPLANRLSGYQYHVVAGRDNTSIAINDIEIRLQMGEYYMGNVDTQVITTIKSNKPIMIVQYSKGTESDGRDGDPAMVTVPPIEEYNSRVEFPVYDFSAAGITDTYLAVTVECNRTAAIRLDNTMYYEMNRIVEYDTRTPDGRHFCTIWTAVDGGTHVLSGESPNGIADETVFTSMVYGVGHRIAYLYNPGFNLEKMTCTIPNVGSSPARGEVPCETLRPKICRQKLTESAYGKMMWRETTPNTVVSADIRCPTNTISAGLPVASRLCRPHPRLGAVWSSTINYTNCNQLSKEISPVVLAEVQIDETNVEAVSDVLQEITSNMNQVDGNMIQSISATLENIVSVASPSPEVTTSVGKAVNNLISSIDDSDSSSGQLAASSSSVVRSLERQISLTLQESGAFNLTEPNVVVRAVTFDTVAMTNGVEFSGSELGGNSSGASIKLPTSIFTRDSKDNGTVGATSSETKVRFIMFNSDALFRTDDVTMSSGRVISAAVENTTVAGLADPVLITYDGAEVMGDNTTAMNQSLCVYWDFSLRNGIGDWSSRGCELVDVSGSILTCACDHLTNFAVLMDISGQHQDRTSSLHFALDLLSKIGCSVSIVALIITIIVFISFRRLRNSRPRRILLHFSMSLLGLYLVFLFGIDHAAGCRIACVAVGALIHYFLLATMLWMGVEATNMYLMIIRVFDEEGPHFLKKACLVAWGAPIVVVATTAVIRTDDYLHKPYCFLTPGLSFYFAVLLPIGVVLAFNFVMFLVVVRRLWTANLGGNVPLDSDEKEARFKQLRVRLLNAFSISVLLGLTWVFGFLAIEDATFIFQLIFCIANSFQGLVVFILFCVRQEDVRKSIRPHYHRITGMLTQTSPRGPATVTAYSLTRSTSRLKDGDRSSRPSSKNATRESSSSVKYSSKATSEMEAIASMMNDGMHDYHE